MADNKSDVIIWFIAGVSVGAAVGLLCAPASGAETRRKIAKKTLESRESILESSKELMERGRELYEKGRQLADDAAEMFDEGRRLVGG
jgi:gas vesicle protein